MSSPDQPIDFFSIDVEGLDLSVLKSNNWNRYRPTYILAELLETEFENVEKHEIRAICKTRDIAQ